MHTHTHTRRNNLHTHFHDTHTRTHMCVYTCRYICAHADADADCALLCAWLPKIIIISISFLFSYLSSILSPIFSLKSAHRIVTAVSRLREITANAASKVWSGTTSLPLLCVPPIPLCSCLLLLFFLLPDPPISLSFLCPPLLFLLL